MLDCDWSSDVCSSDLGVVTSSSTQCDAYDLQVVEWDGLSVTRSSPNLDGGLLPGVVTASALGLPPASSQRAVLAQATTLNAVYPTCSVCSRAALPGPTEVAVNRAMSSASCPSGPLFFTWERLDFGALATVQERTISILPGAVSSFATVTAVDPTRTFVFASTQSAYGQAMGESGHAVASVPQEATFLLDLSSPTSVTYSRTSASSAASLTFYVVQLE
jgi:hypothetical protein